MLQTELRHTYKWRYSINENSEPSPINIDREFLSKRIRKNWELRRTNLEHMKHELRIIIEKMVFVMLS